jgi:hypothetical protein
MNINDIETERLWEIEKFHNPNTFHDGRCKLTFIDLQQKNDPFFDPEDFDEKDNYETSLELYRRESDRFF